MAMTEIWMPSPNYRSGRTAYNKAVIHSTEGARTIRDLGNFFANPNAGVSSHFGADNAERGVVGAYVYESNTAWTQGNANPYCISIELCTPSGASANWTRSYWLNNQDTLLRNTADWVAWMCSKYSIPIVALSNAQAQDPGVKGVCQHSNLGSWGGGHVDCGNGFPMDQVIAWAKGGTPPPVTGGNDDMAASNAWWEDNEYMACVGANDSRIYYAGPDTKYVWTMVDPNSSAKSGAGIAINTDGTTAIIYTNKAGTVCTYKRQPGASAWVWSSKGGNAR